MSAAIQEPPEPGQDISFPWMSKDEAALVTSYLRPNMSVLEWGAGGSTIYFSPMVRKWESIEHNPAWADRVRREVEERGLANVTVTLEAISKPPHYNGPYYPGYEKAFEPYVATGCRAAIAEKLDAVFIDGRSRLACALGIHPFLPSSAVVFFHDFFNKNRARYKPVLNGYRLLDFVTGGQTLAVFRPR